MRYKASIITKSSQTALKELLSSPPGTIYTSQGLGINPYKGRKKKQNTKPKTSPMKNPPQQRLIFDQISIIHRTLTNIWNKNLLPTRSCTVTQANYNEVSLFSYFTTLVKKVGSRWKMLIQFRAVKHRSK